MDNTYNFNGIYRAFSKSGEETLSVSIFRGTASFVVFKKGGDKRPVVKVPLPLAACLKIGDDIEKLLAAQPETRIPFVQLSFNKEARTFETEATLVFFKDDRRCYGVEITSKQLTTPVRFYFKCPSTMSSGNEAMTDEQKSQLGLRELKMVILSQIPAALMLSRFNMETMPNRNGGGNTNRGGGGYQQRPAGSRDPYSSGGSEEDSIFG